MSSSSNNQPLELRVGHSKGTFQRLREAAFAAPLYLCITGLIPLTFKPGDSISEYFHELFPTTAIDYQSANFDPKGKYEKAIREVAEFNHLDDPNRIQVGSEVYIPLSLVVEYSPQIAQSCATTQNNDQKGLINQIPAEPKKQDNSH